MKKAKKTAGDTPTGDVDTRGVAGLSSLSESSGGNALLSALAACRHVALYGSGLLRLREEGELVYSHFYDAGGAGRCASPSAQLDRQSCNRAACQEARRRWRRDRLETEVLLHALHALGIVAWQWAT